MEEWTLLIRVLVAAVLAGVIGAERELHGRPAGLRTHLLVGTGAALVMVTFALTARVLPSDGMWGQLVRVDPGRLAAGDHHRDWILGCGNDHAYRGLGLRSDNRCVPLVCRCTGDCRW